MTHPIRLNDTIRKPISHELHVGFKVGRVVSIDRPGYTDQADVLVRWYDPDDREDLVSTTRALEQEVPTVWKLIGTS